MDKEHKEGSQGAQLEGKYANNFRIGHNALEFIIEFGQVYEGLKQINFHTRIITNPIYAKELAIVLSQSIEKYELSHGLILNEDELY